MKKWLLASSLLLSIGAANAQSIPFPGPGGVGASVPFSITFGAVKTNATPSGNVFTFASTSIPNSDATRVVYVGIALAGCTTSCGVASVTVNGNAATQATSAAQTPNVNVATDWWYVACGTACGTSTTVTVTSTTATGRATIAPYSILGTGNAFSSAGGSSSASGLSTTATLTVPAGGGTIGYSVLNGGSTASFTNLTQDLQDNTCCGSRMNAAGHDTSHSGSTAFTTTFTVTASAIAGSYVTISQ